MVLPWPVLGATSSLEAEGGRREQAELAASASALVGVRAVGTSVQVSKNYVDCSVFGCTSAYFFGKNGDSAASGGDAAKGATDALKGLFGK